MGDKLRGLYPEGKFILQRRDGSDARGGKHDGCQYFVLDITHDPHAIPAIRAYSNSARADGYELLADDLDRISAAAPADNDAESRFLPVVTKAAKEPCRHHARGCPKNQPDESYWCAPCSARHVLATTTKEAR